MEYEIEVHAYHGWGFDAQFWNPIRSLIGKNVLFKPADRGYYGTEFIPEYDSQINKKILLLHSFGLHWCAVEIMEQADIIILLNSFDAFHPIGFTEKSRSKKILKGMEKQFDLNPDVVLNAFFKNCFGNGTFTSPSLTWKNISLLHKDLSKLHKTSFKLSKKIKADFLIIDSGKDRIVPGGRGDEIRSKIKDAKYFVFKDGVHALPASNPQECLQIISEAFPIFEMK